MNITDYIATWRYGNIVSYRRSLSILVTYCNVMGHTKMSSYNSITMNCYAEAMPGTEILSYNGMFIDIKTQ